MSLPRNSLFDSGKGIARRHPAPIVPWQAGSVRSHRCQQLPASSTGSQ